MKRLITVGLLSTALLGCDKERPMLTEIVTHDGVRCVYLVSDGAVSGLSCHWQTVNAPPALLPTSGQLTHDSLWTGADPSSTSVIYERK